MKKLIIFDYDGVLADSMNAVIDSINEIGREHSSLNCHITPEDFQSIEDMTYGEIILKSGIPKTKLDEAVPLLFEKFVRKTPGISFFDGINDLLKKLAEKHDVVVISGNIQPIIEEKLKQEGVLNTISHIWGADSPGDKAEKILKSIEMFNSAPGKTFMIGDSGSDIFFAKKAGVNSIAVTWGWQSVEGLKKENPDHVVESPEQLLNILY